MTLDVGSISSSPPSLKSSDIVVLPCKLEFLFKAFDLVFARSACKHWICTSAYVIFSTLLRDVWDAHHRTFGFIKHIHLFSFFKWPIISLDKTSSGIVYSPLKLHWNCQFNLQPFGVHWNKLYGYKSWNVFSKKKIQLEKEIHKHLGWHGGE